MLLTGCASLSEERKTRARMIGDFLREAAVLIAVLMPLEMYVQHGYVTVWQFLLSEGFAFAIMWLGMILEGGGQDAGDPEIDGEPDE